jgi:hypothetical protein
MRAGARKESVGSRGGTAWNDGVHPIDGGSTGELSSVVSTTKDADAPAVTTFGGGADALSQTSWFAPIEDKTECKDGVCPVPWFSTPTLEFVPTVKEDSVNHPPHYVDGGIECIEAIEAELTTEEYRGYLKGNIAKYVWRERHKGGTESLKKAKWYLDRLIQLDEG